MNSLASVEAAAKPALDLPSRDWRPWDPRLYQIATLAGLLTYGVWWLDLEVQLPIAVAILTSVLAAQLVCDYLAGRPRFDPRSALISGLSLCLLLRTGSLDVAMLTAVVAIASKFTLRVRGKHVFNPTNFALVAMMLVTGSVWVSPGQWGSGVIFAFLLASAGGLVVNRAARADVTCAFLVSYAALLVGRSLWHGEPLAIPLHRLENGALVLFSFFMISDPKTTPDSRAGRVLFAGLVALGAYVVQFWLFRTNGLLWSLAVCSLAVPLIDLLLPGPRYQWGKEPSMKLTTTLTATALTVALTAPAALAFCGFYVAKADTKLFNQASQVVLVRNEDKTVITMANDFKGDPKEFAIVVPVPAVLEKGQIRVGDRALIEHLDTYSSPRLVEYFDEDPCSPRTKSESRGLGMFQRAAPSADAMAERARGLGVTIEARYTVGEYDILILSAKESAGLETWLRDSGYRLPTGASAVLGSYLRQGMKFFVARVNLLEQARLGFTYLRPLQMAFESPKFMLPIRLGTLNADGQQELFVYALTRKGRVETTNYRTVRLPTGMDLPVYVKEEFPQFYRAMFAEQVKREAMRAVFLEYAWDMSWCDPCAAQPLSPEELRKLGVFWLAESALGGSGDRFRRGAGGPVDVFVTRLHVRYDAAHFPEDLVFQETADHSSFQGRYVLRHPWKGEATCEAGEHYRRALRARAQQEAGNLAALTGWPIEEIRRKAGTVTEGTPDARQWWQRLFRE